MGSKMAFRKRAMGSIAIVTFCAFTLMACSGGGGGGNSPAPTPTPTPTSTPTPTTSVSAAASATPGSLDEGQIFQLDASASTDSNGAMLTYSWTQTSGPTVDLGSADTDILTDLKAPEVTADTSASFRVTASNGTDNDTADVTVTFENIHQTPRYSPEPPLAVTAVFSDRTETIFGEIFGFVGTAVTEGGNITLHDITLDAGNNIIATSSFMQKFPPTARFYNTNVRYESAVLQPQVMVIDEASDSLEVFVKPQGSSAFSSFGSAAITAPCTIGMSTTTATIQSGGFSAKLVGQRNSGMSLVQFTESTGMPPFTREANVLNHVGTTESFCAISIDYSSRQRVVAVDTDTNTIHLFDIRNSAGGGGLDIVELSKTSIDFEGASGLQFVASAPAHDFFGRLGLALVYTDGEHEGQHRLILIELENDMIVQDAYSWPKGVPTGVTLDNMDVDSNQEIIIFSKTSPDAIVFESTISGADGIIPLGDPAYIDIGLGVTALEPNRKALVSGQALTFVADPDDKEVRAYGTIQ